MCHIVKHNVRSAFARGGLVWSAPVDYLPWPDSEGTAPTGQPGAQGGCHPGPQCARRDRCQASPGPSRCHSLTLTVPLMICWKATGGLVIEHLPPDRAAIARMLS